MRRELDGNRRTEKPVAAPRPDRGDGPVDRRAQLRIADRCGQVRFRPQGGRGSAAAAFSS